LPAPPKGGAYERRGKGCFFLGKEATFPFAEKAPHLGGAGEQSETERVIFRRKTTNVTA
jgi:hypothetical protein